MESADEMEIWGVRWKGRDGKIVDAEQYCAYKRTMHELRQEGLAGQCEG